MNVLKPETWLSNHKVSNVIGYGTVVFIICFLIFFLVLPVSVLVSKAFYTEQGFTLQYFKLLFGNELQTEAILNSLLIGLCTTIFTTLLSIPLAVINTRFHYPGKNWLAALLLVPLVMPPFVGAIGIQRFFARRGSVNLLLMQLGIIDTPIDWLSEEFMFFGVVLLEVLHLYPIMYLNLTAALANIDPSVEEMAALMGAKRLRRIKDIVWPLARPGYFAGAIIVFIWSFTDLGTPLLVGFYQTIPVKIFNSIADVNENPIGFALVFIVIVISVLTFLISKLLISGKKYEMMARGHVTNLQMKTKTLGTAAIYLITFLTIGLALIPHISVFLTSVGDKWFMTVLPEHYTLEYYAKIFDNDLAVTGIENSLFYSSLSTFLDIFLGLLVAYVVTRKLIPFANILDGLVMIPLALPGIVIAFGYVVTYTDTILDPMIYPVPLLVIAYAIRRIPYLVRSASAGLQQISSTLEEASATFGATRFYTLRKITFPLVFANIIAGSLLCFAYAMLDVSDSLILAMKDRFYPLTKAIYALFLEHGSGEMVSSALGMVGMLILTLCILLAALLLGKKMGVLFKN